jgi:hypothetical protein
LFIR